MSSSGIDKVMSVWESKNKILAPSKKNISMKVIDAISNMVTIGPFFYFILNFHEYKIEYTSGGSKEIMGIDPEKLTLEQVLEAMHPEDKEKLFEKEAVSLDFTMNHISSEEILLYKISYLLRIQNKKGEFKTFLYQATPINVSIDGKIQHVLGVLTDVDHFNIKVDHKISFISQQRPSYYSLETTPPYKFVPNDFAEKFTKQEITVIKHISEGKDYKQIAGLLEVSPNTINTHKRNILKKSKCRNTAELVARSIKEGVI